MTQPPRASSHQLVSRVITAGTVTSVTLLLQRSLGGAGKVPLFRMSGGFKNPWRDRPPRDGVPLGKGAGGWNTWAWLHLLPHLIGPAWSRKQEAMGS